MTSKLSCAYPPNTANVVPSKNVADRLSSSTKLSCNGHGFPVPHHPGPNGQGGSSCFRS